MEILPTGTATFWRLIEPQDHNETGEHTYVFNESISRFQGREYLAEQLRQDGAASSLGAALSMSETAQLFYGIVQIDDDTGEEIVTLLEPSAQTHLSVIVAKVPFDD